MVLIFFVKQDWLIQKLKRNYWNLMRFCTTAFLACFFAITFVIQLPAATNNSLLGVYYGNNGWQIVQNQALESWQGKKHAVTNLFTNWCEQPSTLENLFNKQLSNIWNNKNVPLITWEPFFCTPSTTPTNIEFQVANGNFDVYLNNWADRLKTFLSGPDGVYNTKDDRRVYIRLAHEMNGNWYPWSAAKGDHNPANYVRMWRRVKSIFAKKEMGQTHLQWIWCVNFTDNGGYRAESFYPGDEYVDWASISGYNWGTTQNWSKWMTPKQTFEPMLTRIHALTKRPVAITEFASTTLTSSGSSVKAKSEWIAAAFNYILAQNIKMVVWFNQDKEADWATFGGAKGNSTFYYKNKTYNTYSAYKKAVRSSHFVSSDTANLRLLTDNQFRGL